MTMHLCGPALSLIGKKKGKRKFRNAEEARKARELDASWQALKEKYNVPAKEKRMGKIRDTLQSSGYKLTTPPGRETARIPSLAPSDHSGSTAPVRKVYTGTKVLGIGTMHKSNAVPIFSDEEAVAIATMRRN